MGRWSNESSNWLTILWVTKCVVAYLSVKSKKLSYVHILVVARANRSICTVRYVISVTFRQAPEHHCPLVTTKLYCLMTEARVREQPAQSRYVLMKQLEVELATFRRRNRSLLTHSLTHCCA